MGDKPGMPPELMAMMQRYNQLGRLLPKIDDDLDLKNPNVRAEVGVGHPAATPPPFHCRQGRGAMAPEFRSASPYMRFGRIDP